MNFETWLSTWTSLLKKKKNKTTRTINTLTATTRTKHVQLNDKSAN